MQLESKEENTPPHKKARYTTQEGRKNERDVDGYTGQDFFISREATPAAVRSTDAHPSEDTNVQSSTHIPDKAPISDALPNLSEPQSTERSSEENASGSIEATDPGQQFDQKQDSPLKPTAVALVLENCSTPHSTVNLSDRDPVRVSATLPKAPIAEILPKADPPRFDNEVEMLKQESGKVDTLGTFEDIFEGAAQESAGPSQEDIPKPMEVEHSDESFLTAGGPLSVSNSSPSTANNGEERRSTKAGPPSVHFSRIDKTGEEMIGDGNKINAVSTLGSASPHAQGPEEINDRQENILELQDLVFTPDEYSSPYSPLDVSDSQPDPMQEVQESFPTADISTGAIHKSIGNEKAMVGPESHIGDDSSMLSLPPMNRAISEAKKIHGRRDEKAVEKPTTSVSSKEVSKEDSLKEQTISTANSDTGERFDAALWATNRSGQLFKQMSLPQVPAANMGYALATTEETSIPQAEAAKIQQLLFKSTRSSHTHDDPQDPYRIPRPSPNTEAEAAMTQQLLSKLNPSSRTTSAEENASSPTSVPALTTVLKASVTDLRNPPTEREDLRAQCEAIKRALQRPRKTRPRESPVRQSTTTQHETPMLQFISMIEDLEGRASSLTINEPVMPPEKQKESKAEAYEMLDNTLNLDKPTAQPMGRPTTTKEHTDLLATQEGDPNIVNPVICGPNSEEAQYTDIPPSTNAENVPNPKEVQDDEYDSDAEIERRWAQCTPPNPNNSSLVQIRTN